MLIGIAEARAFTYKKEGQQGVCCTTMRSRFLASHVNLVHPVEGHQLDSIGPEWRLFHADADALRKCWRAHAGFLSPLSRQGIQRRQC